MIKKTLFEINERNLYKLFLFCDAKNLTLFSWNNELLYYDI